MRIDNTRRKSILFDKEQQLQCFLCHSRNERAFTFHFITKFLNCSLKIT